MDAVTAAYAHLLPGGRIGWMSDFPQTPDRTEKSNFGACASASGLTDLFDLPQTPESTVIIEAYASVCPSNRVRDLFDLPQTSYSVLDGFSMSNRDPLTILIPSAPPPFAYLHVSMLQQILNANWPWLREHRVNHRVSFFSNPDILEESSIEDLRPESEPEPELEYDTSDLPDEDINLIDEWLFHGGTLCGFYLKPRVERFVNWFQTEYFQDDDHRKFCELCDRYTKSLYYNRNGRMFGPPYEGCYLCVACHQCGFIHYSEFETTLCWKLSVNGDGRLTAINILKGNYDPLPLIIEDEFDTYLAARRGKA